MDGHISIVAPDSVLVERFEAMSVEPVSPRYGIGPGDDLPVIGDHDPSRIDLLPWGGRRPDGPDPATVSLEAITASSRYRYAFERRRCLILADGLYGWPSERDGGRPRRATRTDGQPFAIAGLRVDERSGTDDGAAVAVVTTRPDEAETVYSRLPAVLTASQGDAWLRGRDRDELLGLIESTPGCELRARRPVRLAAHSPGSLV